MCILLTREKVSKEDLLLYAYSREKTFFNDFALFCNNKPQSIGKAKLARQTMANYLKELVKDGLLAKSIKQEDKYHHYYVPKNKYQEVKTIQAELEFKKLPLEEQTRIMSKSSREKEKERIMNTLALSGWLKIDEIAVKTVLSTNKVLEAIWGTVKEHDLPLTNSFYTSLIGRRYIDADKNFQLPSKFRSYGLSFEGLYWALKKFPENINIIVEKWGSLHPFVFDRFQLYKKHGLIEFLQEFFNKLDPINFRLLKDEMIKEVEDMLIDFIPRSGERIINWFRFIHENGQFRDRVKIRYKERLKSHKESITTHERALKTINKLASSSPNWEELNQRDSLLFVILM